MFPFCFDMDENTTDTDIENLRGDMGLSDQCLVVIENEIIEYSKKPIFFENKYFHLYKKIQERLGNPSHNSFGFMDICVDYRCADVCYTVSGKKVTVGLAERMTISNPGGDRLFIFRFDEPVLEKIHEAHKIVKLSHQTARLQFTYDMFQFAFVARVDSRDLARRRITVAATSEKAAETLATYSHLFL